MHVFAALASKRKLHPYEAFKHLEGLWGQVADAGARLSEPVVEPAPTFAGLSAEEARARLRRYGPNEAVRARRITVWDRLFDAVKNPLVLLLVVLGAISYATDDIRSAVVILGMHGAQRGENPQPAAIPRHHVQDRPEQRAFFRVGKGHPGIVGRGRVHGPGPLVRVRVAHGNR